MDNLFRICLIWKKYFFIRHNRVISLSREYIEGLKELVKILYADNNWIYDMPDLSYITKLMKITFDYNYIYYVPASCLHGVSDIDMMTSSNGNTFRVTGHLCGEFTGHRWIPGTKASGAELCCFLWSAPE